MMFSSGMKESRLYPDLSIPIPTHTATNHSNQSNENDSNNNNNKTDNQSTPSSSSSSSSSTSPSTTTKLVEIVVEDVRLPVFQALLEYCYCGNVALNPKFIMELFMACNQYRLGELKVSYLFYPSIYIYLIYLLVSPFSSLIYLPIYLSYLSIFYIFIAIMRNIHSRERRCKQHMFYSPSSPSVRFFASLSLLYGLFGKELCRDRKERRV